MFLTHDLRTENNQKNINYEEIIKETASYY